MSIIDIDRNYKKKVNQKKKSILQSNKSYTSTSYKNEHLERKLYFEDRVKSNKICEYYITINHCIF